MRATFSRFLQVFGALISWIHALSWIIIDPYSIEEEEKYKSCTSSRLWGID